MLKLLVLILLILLNVNCQYSENTYFANSRDLNQYYRLDWNYTETDIVFRITVNSTHRWVGFGLSPNGGMLNSDIFLAWTAFDGSIQFRDAHTEGFYNVITDSTQNWQNLYYLNKGGITTVIVKRALKVCNPWQPVSEINIDITQTQFVIYSWGSDFSDVNVPAYHGPNNRGAKFLPILATLNEKITLDMSQVETIDFRVNVSDF